MKTIKIFLVFLLLSHFCNAQQALLSPCPSLFIGKDTSLSCNSCITLHATKFQIKAPTTYQVDSIPFTPYPYAGSVLFTGTDDVWSDTISLPFPFCFFGNTYRKMVVGSNELITFNTAQANAYNAWNFYSPQTPSYPDLLSGTCTVGSTCGDAANSIMCPYQDIDPSLGGTVLWQIYGIAPCRRLVVSWDSVPMFNTSNCPGQFGTSQCVLYEGTGVIEIYIKEKDSCSAWNQGEAAEGIEDATGSTAYMVNGRNLPTVWAAYNDGRRFTPTGSAYPVRIDWYDINNNLLLYNSDSFTVCLNGVANKSIYAKATYYTCSNDSVIVKDTIKLTSGGVTTSVTNFVPVHCHNETNASFTYNILSSTPLHVYLGGTLLGTNHTYSFSNLGPTALMPFYVVDSFGCMSHDTVKIVNPSALFFSHISHTNATCNGSNDGTASVLVGGGTSPYFDTINGISSTQFNLNTLTAGSYHFVFTDAHHCTIDTTISISQPLAFTVLIKNVKEPSCFGYNDGEVVVNVLPYNTYTYLVDGIVQGTNDTLKKINAGTHTIRAQTNVNCFHDTTITINQPAKFITWVNDSLDISCKGLQNGHFAISSVGGTKFYSYEIPKLIPSFLTDSVFPNLPPNHYVIYGKDLHGCLDTASVIISEPDSVLTESKITDDASCYFKTDGKILVTAYGGTPPYNIHVTPVDNTTYLSPTQVETGFYRISVVDNHGCSLTDSAFIDVKCCLALLPNAFTPNGDGVDDIYRILNAGDFLNLNSFQIFNRWGEMVYGTTDKNEGWNGQYKGNPAPIGTYMYQLSVNCSKGRTLQLKGNVTLLR